MLIDTNFTIAYRCPVCGSLRFVNASLFGFLTELGGNSGGCCGCNIVVAGTRKGVSRITVPCIGCGGCHKIIVDLKKVVRNNIGFYICENTGIQYCFIGNDDYVQQMVDMYEKELDGIADCLGYDNYFKNSHVMLDTLIKLHEIAEQGNLLCECGSEDIEITLLPDRIYLKCRNCPGEKEIYASSNKDLKDILLKKRMLLSRHFDRIL
jgi:hypothetical protein